MHPCAVDSVQNLTEIRDTASKKMKDMWCIGLVEAILQWIDFIPPPSPFDINK